MGFTVIFILFFVTSMKIKLVHTFNKNDWFSFQPTDQKPLEIQHFIKGIIIKQWSSFWPCMCMCLTLCKVINHQNIHGLAFKDRGNYCRSVTDHRRRNEAQVLNRCRFEIEQFEATKGLKTNSAVETNSSSNS